MSTTVSDIAELAPTNRDSSSIVDHELVQQTLNDMGDRYENDCLYNRNVNRI